MNEHEFEKELAFQTGQRAYYWNTPNNHKPGTPGHTAWIEGFNFSKEIEARHGLLVNKAL